MAKYVISTTFPQINYHVDANADILQMGNFTLTSVQITPPPTLVINDIMAPQVNIMKQAVAPMPSPFCIQEQVPLQVQPNMFVSETPNINMTDNPMVLIHQNPQQTIVTQGMNVTQSTISLNNHNHVIALS